MSKDQRTEAQIAADDTHRFILVFVVGILILGAGGEWVYQNLPPSLQSAFALGLLVAFGLFLWYLVRITRRLRAYNEKMTREARSKLHFDQHQRRNREDSRHQ